jgi:hypothetical protein
MGEKSKRYLISEEQLDELEEMVGKGRPIISAIRESQYVGTSENPMRVDVEEIPRRMSERRVGLGDVKVL